MSKSKKELKQFINENGFFLQFDKLDIIKNNDLQIEENAIKTGVKVPEGENIVVFKGLASQAFEVGEASRNEYKIDPKGWDFTNYSKNSQILLSHDSSEPVGKAISLTKGKDGLQIQFYVNTDWLDEVNAKRVRGGAFSGLSTGHITHEVKFENNETGEILDSEEAEEKYGLDFWDMLWSDAWTKIVTKAELVEVSLVTLPSNPDALILNNSLQKYFENQMKTKKPNNIEEEKKEDVKTDQPTTEDKEKEVETPEEKNEPENGTEAPEEKPTETPETPENGEQVETPENGDEVSEDEKQEISEENYIELEKEIEAKAKELNSLKKIKSMVKTKSTIEKKDDNNSKSIQVNESETLRSMEALLELVSKQNNIIVDLNKKIAEMDKVLDSIPSQKGMRLTNQYAPSMDV